MSEVRYVRIKADQLPSTLTFMGVTFHKTALRTTGCWPIYRDKTLWMNLHKPN